MADIKDMVKINQQLSATKPALLDRALSIQQSSFSRYSQYLGFQSQVNFFPTSYTLLSPLVSQVQQMQLIVPRHNIPYEIIGYANEINSMILRATQQMEPLLSSSLQLTTSIVEAIQPTIREVSTLINQLDLRLFNAINAEELFTQYQTEFAADDILDDDTSLLDTEQLYEDIKPFLDGINLKEEFLKYFPEFHWKSFLCWVVKNIIIPTIIGLVISKSSPAPIAQTTIENHTVIENQTVIIISPSTIQITPPEERITSTNWKRHGSRKKTKRR